ncbi:hypothetical protein NQT62_07035 [Limnobacter humi]|uniref:Uncharacterized protein n=1 Tax=Limnobacter humi TaxID=1778671 RepID=A0ABT1WFA0_9BURK|nr:hypothetical protein [Limnobacter humi]MCQ8896190.1 hypothetical protein [Limnobacter humi]
MSNKLIRLGFLSAGLTNLIGMLAVSEAFTNTLFNELSPTVFSNFGAVCIMLWGLAYLSVAHKALEVPLLCLVFAVEKFLYTGTWVVWAQHNWGQLATIQTQSPQTALFYSSYGLIDLAYGLFFLWVALLGFKQQPPAPHAH